MTSKTHTIVKLWLIVIPKSNQLSAALIKNLDNSQQQHYKGLSLKRQNVYCLTRVLLNYALADALDDKNINWKIEERQDLPPIITLAAQGSNTTRIPKFSISHTKNIIGVTIGEANCLELSQLGLDIEEINSKRRLESADYFCNKDQLNELYHLTDSVQQSRYITRLWTQKEAYFKSYSQAILSPKLKALSISESETSDETIFTTSLDNANELSIYSNTRIKIQPQWLTIDAVGKAKKLLTHKLNWQSYDVFFN